jgi:two-component system sensor histidine kinase KdpD
MLEAARVRKAEGVDIVVGLAMTHGRKETERLLEGLEIVPSMKVSYKGVQLDEFDLDGILRRSPEIALVDELAHTNIPGSRHVKRYMDVEELLESGIDVYTTLNIQHLESFQDPIEQATGIVVRERVPDKILDEADEIELIDLAPEDLLERLRQGKVYVPDQAARAVHKFFRKENLELLREISLRKTASIVDSSRTKGPTKVEAHKLAPKLLASIGPSPFSERVVRVTKRLADMLRAEWLVVSVETPDTAFLSEEQKGLISNHLKLAEELGAKVLRLPGESIADTILEFAQANRVTQIILGHSMMPWYRRLYKRSPVDELVKKGGTIDIYVISSGQGEKLQYQPLKKPTKARSFFYSLFLPLTLVGLLTLIIDPLSRVLSLTLIALFYLLSVALAALFLPPLSFYVYVVAAIFVLDSFYIRDLDMWMPHGEPILFSAATFLVGVLVNRLTFTQRRLAKIAVARHQELLRLFDVSKDLAAAAGPAAMLSRLSHHLLTFMPAEALLYVSEDGEFKKIGHTTSPFDATEEMAARWAVEHQEAAGRETDTLPSAKGFWLPLTVARKKVGALGIYPVGNSSYKEHEALLTAFAHLMALSLDRSVQD